MKTRIQILAMAVLIMLAAGCAASRIGAGPSDPPGEAVDGPEPARNWSPRLLVMGGWFPGGGHHGWPGSYGWRHFEPQRGAGRPHWARRYRPENRGRQGWARPERQRPAGMWKRK